MKKFANLPANQMLYTAQQIKAIEADFAAKNTQKSTYPLMLAAGESAFQLLLQTWPRAKRILVLCGKGNNGGDGLILARLAFLHRLNVTLCGVGFEREKSEPQDDAFQAMSEWLDCGGKNTDWTSLNFEKFDVIVDALLGTGLQGGVRKPYSQIIEKANHSGVPILAIDIPSGVNANTGSVENIAIKASATATFIGYKRGLYTGVAGNFRGAVSLLKLSVDNACYQAAFSSDVGGNDFSPPIKAINWHSLKHLLVPRATASHKGLHGHCGFIGGSAGMLGAAVLATTSAIRSGAGWVSAWVEEQADILVTRQPEIMAKLLKPSEIEDIAPVLNRVNALIVGSGMGQSEWAQRILFSLEQTDSVKRIYKVYDADALNWLAEHPHFDSRRILTPHPGEAAKLLKTDNQTINSDRFSACLTIAKQYGGVCVLKGAGTIVADQHGQMVVCAVGNPGMAVAGMGDLLSGIIGALLAQGFELFDAAQLGVCIHGEAAERAAGENNYFRGLLASDLIEHLLPLLNPSVD